MTQKTSRLLLIYNPNSSKFCHVKKDILDHRAELFADYATAEYIIKKIPFEENVQALEKEIRDSDLVLALGGDATAAIAANAILHSEKDAALAVLPYGNFNDLARTLKTNSINQIFDKKPINLYPLEIYVNGKFWRYATCYVTIGMTAESVKLFDEPKFRKHMQKGHKSSISSYFQLAKWYFKNRRKKRFLTEFTVNGLPAAKDASDYAAVSGRSMCRVMKGGDDYKKPKVFRSKTAKLTSFPRLADLMIKSMFHRVPGKETKGDSLEFIEPTTLELQAEGEYQVFKNVKTIEVKKGNRCLKVIQN